MFTLLQTTRFIRISNSEIRRKMRGLTESFDSSAMKPEQEKIFEYFLLLMAGSLSDFQAANTSFLKLIA